MNDRNDLHVVFKVGDAEYAIAAEKVFQMESYPEEGATPVPGTPPYVAGIVQVRGRVVPVVDLRARFGLPPAERTLDTRLVVGEDGEKEARRTVALLVDSAREVVRLLPEQLEPPPRVLTWEAQGYIQAVARVPAAPRRDDAREGEPRAQTRLLLIIDFHKVIGEESSHAG